MRQRLIAVGRRAGGVTEMSLLDTPPWDPGEQRKRCEQLWTGSSTDDYPSAWEAGAGRILRVIGGRRSRPCAVDLGRSAGLEAEASGGI